MFFTTRFSQLETGSSSERELIKNDENSSFKYCNFTNDNLNKCENNNADNVPRARLTLRNIFLGNILSPAFLLILIVMISVCSGDPNQHSICDMNPPKPENLTILKKTSYAALLQWDVPHSVQNCSQGFHHRIMYRLQGNNQKPWRVDDITDDTKKFKRFHILVSLDANAIYDVRVFIKSASAIGEDKWSEFNDVIFRTSPKSALSQIPDSKTV